MAEIIFRDGKVFLKEELPSGKTIETLYYNTIADYENSLNKPTIDETQSKLDALGEGLAYLLGVINNA